MRLSTTFLASVCAAMASAQNMFTMATLPTSLAVGSTFNITWQATTPGTVSLLLVQAASAGSTLVKPVSTIAANITNSGAFAWIPSSMTAKGSGYAIEIVDDANPYITNYSGQFAIDSTVTASSSAASSVSGSMTSSGATAASSSPGSSTSGLSMTTTSSGMTTTASTTGTAATTMSTVTTTSGSATTKSTGSAASATSASSTASASATAKIGGAAVDTARSGFALLAALGVAVLFL